MRARLIAAATAVTLAATFAGGCSRGSDSNARGPRVTAPVARVTDASQVPDDVEARGLAEPKARTETEELIFKASRIYDFCTAWAVLDRIEEPDPLDPVELNEFAIIYYDTLRYIDPDRKVRERVPAERGRPERVKQVELSDDAISDLDALRKMAFEYRVRVASWKAYYDQGVFDEPELHRRLDRAFELFAAEDVTVVQQRLTHYEKEHCDL